MESRAGVLTLALWLTAAASPAADPAVGGNLVLIGGGRRPPAVMAKFVELAGGPEAPIVVLPTASAEPDTGPKLKAGLESGQGCSNVTVLEVRTRGDAGRPDWVEQLRSARGVFFSGGDQRRIVEALLGTPMLEAMRAAYARGAAIGGTSAGTACMSPLMITGEGNFDVITAGNVELVEGLGLLPGTIVDQHFVARQRHNRLLAVVLEHPDSLGVGIDEATAAWIGPDGVLQVLGEGQVVMVDASRAVVRRGDGPGRATLIGGRDLRLHVLLPGERFDLASRTVLPPAAETR